MALLGGKVFFEQPVAIDVDGSLAAPSLTFTDPACGFFHTGAGATSAVHVAVNGADVLAADAAGLVTLAGRFADGALGAPAITFTSDVACGLFHTGAGAASAVRVAVNGFDVLDVVSDGVAISGTFVETSRPLLALPATVERITTDLNLSATKQWNNGTIVLQREMVIRAPTYSFVGPATQNITTAATLNITDAPISGPNCAIQNPYAALIQGTLAVGPSGTANLQILASLPRIQTRGFSQTIEITGANLFLQSANPSSTGTVTIGHGSPLSSSVLHVVASNKSVATRFDGIYFATEQVTVSTTANPVGVNKFTVEAPTYRSPAGATVSFAATQRISGAPTGSAVDPATIIHRYALWVDADAVRLDGGQVVASRQVLVGASPYAVDASGWGTDYCLEVQSNGGAITVTLPALTGGTQDNGRVIVVKDSGDNAGVNNITVARGNVADKIDNVAASYTISVSGAALWFKANTTNNDWEII